MTLFRDNLIANPDPIFLHHKDCEGKKDVCHFIELIYQEVAPFLGDKNIEQRLQESFHSFVWQFYLGYILKHNGLKLSKASAFGPDYVLEYGVIVEAVVPTRGEGENKTFHHDDLEPEEVSPGFKMYPVVSRIFPDPKIILRITSAINSKLDQYQSWKKSNLILKDSPYIIGINALMLDAHSSDDFSYGARVCFGIGPTQINIPVRTHKNQNIEDRGITTTIRFDSHLKKHNGVDVLTSLFFDDRYKDVSAIAYSSHYIANVMDDPGRDIEIIANPNAKNPIDLNSFKKFKRTYIEYSQDMASFTVKKLKRNE
jgi:hypothetical protein